MRKRTDSEELWMVIVVVLMLVFVLFMLQGCKVKKNIQKESTETSKVERVEVSSETITATNTKTHTKITELLNGNSIIYPRGKFIFEYGRFEGEADSVITYTEALVNTSIDKQDTTNTKTEQVEDRLTFDQVKTDSSIKQIERTPNFLGWIGGLVLFLFFIFIVWKVTSWKP